MKGKGKASELTQTGESSAFTTLLQDIEMESVTSTLLKEYDKLFNNLHLQFIHSTYFGPRGSTEASRSKHPFQKALADALPSTVKIIDPVDPYVMKMSLSKYMTNFQNIWTNKKRFNKMLNYVIIVLLRIHLSPEHERIKREKIANRTLNNRSRQQIHTESSSSVVKITIINKSYNEKKRLFLNEMKLRAKYWERQKVIQSIDPNGLLKPSDRENRNQKAEPVLETDENKEIDLEIIADENPVATQEALALEDESVDTTKDISSRRLNRLRAIIRNPLYKNSGSTIDERDIRSALPGVGPDEMKICLLINSFLLPYIPKKAKWNVLIQQIHFFLMSNDLLRSVGCSKFTMRLVPIIKPSTIQTLKIDAPSIFSLLCSSNTNRNMDLYDFDDSVITSKQVATESKDAVFSSFFDIKQIRTLCANHGLEFAHNICVLPGLTNVNRQLKTAALFKADILRKKWVALDRAAAVL
ncbi:MAG: hypothetical protein EXX96DRAFT_652326, partial [Benjaminiella poitrasii]